MFLLMNLIRKNVGKGISLDGAGVSTEDMLKETVEEIDQSKTVDDEEEKYTSHTKDEEDESTKVNDLPPTWKSSKGHPIDNILGDISKE